MTTMAFGLGKPSPGQKQLKLVLNRLSLIGEVGTSIRLSVQVNLCIVLLLLLSPECMHFPLHTKVVLNPITLGTVITQYG